MRLDVAGEPGAVRHAALDLEAMHVAYACTRDSDLRAVLVARYDELAMSVVRQFRTRREGFDDLVQVGRIGLLHAVDRFDPNRGLPFAAFARATIVGELKRHLRDSTWALRVPRSLQENYLAVVRAADDLTARLGRSPRISEVAHACGLGEEQVLEAMELGRHQRPASLDVREGEGAIRASDPGMPERGLDHVENRSVANGLLTRLSEQERQIVTLRYVDGLTQQEIAQRIGMSQMYVSRLLGRILERMRVLVTEP